jgi:hypothetical protein
LRQIDAVAEMAMIEHVHRAASLERRSRRLEAASVAFLPRIQSKSHREDRQTGSQEHVPANSLHSLSGGLRPAGPVDTLARVDPTISASTFAKAPVDAP